jgi:rod shape-determining protein MreC
MKNFFNKKSAFLAAVIILLIFFHYVGLLKKPEGIIIGTLNPFSRFFYGLSLKISSSSGPAVGGESQQIIDSLESQNRELVVENAELKNLEEENRLLRQQLNFFSNNKHAYILADIISYDYSSLEQDQSLIINRGSNDGIVKGLVLTDSQGAVIGRITDVQDNISRACLINAASCKFTVSIQDEGKTSGIAEGDLGLSVKMNFIPMSESISEGSNVVTSGLEKNIPRGLVIGRVSNVSHENNEIWQSATIEPLADLRHLIFASIILP